MKSRLPTIIAVATVRKFAIVTLLSFAPAVYSQQADPQTIELRRQIAELKQQVAELNARLAEKSKASTLDQQEQCANRAFKDFEDWGYKVKDNSDFVGYYNAKLDRCFVQFQNTLGNGRFFWRELFDAYSGKEYGQYGWERDEHKKYWEVPPFVCHVAQVSGEDKYCKSEDEFTELAKSYMGN